MLRLILTGAGLASVIVSATFASAAEKDVIGKSGGHRWEFMGTPSGPAAVGKPEGRLQVPARNGDIVRFKVESGTHGVLFEKAKSLAAGTWEVVPGSGTLKDLPAAPAFDRFDRKNAQTTDAEAAGNDVIEIKITNLRGGLENGILFACNPHSSQGSANQATMLGVIILAADEKQKK